MSTITIPILHFNDVCKITRPRSSTAGRDELSPINGNDTLADHTFDHVVRFSETINQIRRHWPRDVEHEPQGLVLFSGDLFSPSVESMLTRGPNMVHVMNEIRPDACLPGNHEFDHGRERFNQLIEFSNFPWVLSNVKEKFVRSPGEPAIPKGLCEYCVFNRCGVTIGVVGLMSKVAIKATPIGARANLVDSDMIEVCRELCKKLRKPKSGGGDGGEGCDIVLALTHAEHFEDIELARALYAYPLSTKPGLDGLPGVDAVFGGHDHSYFLGEGVEAEDRGGHIKPLDGDDGLLIIKSGTDFDDLSEVVIELEQRPEGTQRKMVVKSLKVIRHKMGSVQDIQRLPEQPPMENTLRRLFRQEVLKGLDIPIAQCHRSIQVKDEHLRSRETPLGNWIADVLRERFESIFKDDSVPTVLVLTGASIRGGSTLNGNVLARHIIQLMPFEVSLTSLNLTGDDIRKSLDSALLDFNQSKLQPRMSTRFPVVSGLRLTWDSSAKEDPIRELKVGGRDIDPQGKYRVVTSTYLAGGGSGFDRFKTAKEAAGNLADGPGMHQAVRDYIMDLQAKQSRKELHSYVNTFAQSYNSDITQTADQDILQCLVRIVSEYLGDSGPASISEFTMSAANTLSPPEKVLPELSTLIPENPDGRVIPSAGI